MKWKKKNHPLSLMQPVVTSFVFPLLFSNTQPFLFACVFLVSRTLLQWRHNVISGSFPLICQPAFYTQGVFIFYLKFIFPLKKKKCCFVYQNGKLTFPKTLVTCSTDCPSTAWQMMVMVLLGALQGKQTPECTGI